jgi:group I intron endonuclease
MQGIVYRAFLIEDGRSYIGQTVKKLQKRINEHKCSIKCSRFYFSRALSKYGFSAFKWEILQICSSVEELDSAEIFWIQHFNSTDSKFGFNIKTGGRFGKLPIEYYKNISKRMLGDKNPMFNKKSPIRGMKVSKEISDKIKTKFSKNQIPWNKNKKIKIIKKINYFDAQNIKTMYQNGELIKNIMIKYDIKYNVIKDILDGRTWKNPPKFDEKIINLISLDAKNKKINITELSKKFNLSKRQIKNILNILNIKTRLTKEEVLEIREKFSRKEFSIKQLMKIYNISQSNISLILNNKIWRKKCE